MSGTVKEAHLSFADRFLRVFSYCMVRTVQRPKLFGPKPEINEPVIFAGRHVGLMDPVILMVEYYHRILHPLVARDYYEKNGFVRSFYDHAQCIPIDRNHSGSTQWIEDSIAAFKKEESIIIFPEGKRNKQERGLLPFHRGTAVLAAKSGVKVVPVYNAVWHFPKRYRLAIGEPFSLDPLPEKGITPEWLSSQTEKIRDAVAALEPLVEKG